MPLIDTQGLTSPGIGPQEAAVTYDPDKGGPLGPSFGQLFSTAVDQGIWGTLGHGFSDSVMSGLSGDRTTFDPFPAIQGTQYEAYANKFVDVNTQADFELRKQQIDRELANKATMASVGGAESFMASLAAGFVDPLMLLPVGGAALEGGAAMVNAARAALMTSLTVGAGTIGEEIVLSHLQATRTPEESITNILAATALSGLLGGALHVAFGGGGHAAQSALASRFGNDVADITGQRTNAAAKVYNRLSDAFVAAGRPEAEAKASAALVAANMDATAFHFGTDAVSELDRAGGLDVRAADGTDSLGADQFGQPAYHGSPHIFDKFDSAAIGTGEGNQAYGHGLYFAGRKGIAEYYRKVLSRRAAPRPMVDGSDGAEFLKRLPPKSRTGVKLSMEALADGESLDGLVASYRDMAERRRADAVRRREMIDINKKELPSYSAADEAFDREWADGYEKDAAQHEKDAADALKYLSGKNIAWGERGRLYHVDIPDDHEFLDWDKPLSEQSPHVQAALRNVDAKLPSGFTPGEHLDTISAGHDHLVADRSINLDGQQIYRGLAERAIKTGSPRPYKTIPPEISRQLQDAGIAGIRYLDAGSRSAGEGAHNYVVFDHNRVSIREFEQAGRGMINFGDGKAIISLFSSADASTAPHELGHFFLANLERNAAREGAPATLTADLAAARKWLGLKDGEAIGREHHEQFARGFEAYLREGRAPTTALARVFEQFRQWLTSLYKSASDLNVPMSDEIRSVFDRMLGSDVPEPLKLDASRPDLFGGGAAGNLSAGVAGKALNFQQLKVDSALGAEKLALDPRMRTAQSPSVVTRQVGADLAETPYYLAGNRDGVSTPTAVETLIKQHQAPLAEGLGDLDSAFLKYRTGKGASGPIGAGMAKAGLGIGDLAGQSGGKLDFIRFKEEVAMAMRNGDVHAIPEVAQAAKTLRAKVFNPLRDLAIKHGLLPEGIKPEFADTYLTRLYNTEKITANRNAFIEHLTDWFENEQIRSPEPLSRGELKTQAEEITNTILRSPGNRTLYDIEPNLRGPLKERTLAIPDNVLAPWLVNDVERIAKTYTRTMAADVELAAKFGRADMADQIKEIVDSYDRLAAKTEDGPKQSALKKQMERDVKDIEGMRDRIRGTYGMPDDPHGLASRAFRVVRTLNFVRMLGGMTLSAIPDVGHLVMVHGLQRVLGDGIAPLISSLKAVKLANAETHMAGTALDLVLETRAMQLADIWEDFGRYSKFERSVQWVGDKMGGVSLMGLWNSSIKQFTGLITQARTLQAIEAIASGKGAPAQEVRRLASLGIDAEMAGRIAKEFAAHGDKEGGVYQANTSAWGDAEAARAYRGMLAKEVDQIIVTPGQDRPLWMSSELGKVLGQFKSFTFSSTSKVLINGLQQRDANALQGLIVMAGLGMLATYLKGSLNGSQMPQSPASWIEAGVDQSGMLGWMMDANNLAERTVGVGVNPAIAMATGQATRSNRYSSSGVFGALLGPTAGLAEDSLHMGYDAAHGQFGSADVHRGRRMIPFNNLFYTKWLFDAGERATDETFGLPPPRSATPPQ